MTKANDPTESAKAARPLPPVLLNTLTQNHLCSAFAAESQRQQLLLHFAAIAEIEGHADVAEMLRGLAETHALHAQGHLDMLRRATEPLSGLRMGPTFKNLACALAAEQQAANEVYPPMIKTALAEGFLDIADWLRTIARANEAHSIRLQQVAERLTK